MEVIYELIYGVQSSGSVILGVCMNHYDGVALILPALESLLCADA